jgi:hypothetical protein
LVAQENQVTVFERSPRAGGAFLLAGLAPRFQGVDANPASLHRFIAALEMRCRKAGVVFEFNREIGGDDDVLKGFDLVVLASGAKYLNGLGPVVNWVLEKGLAHLPLLRQLAASQRFRNWFYYKARRSTGRRLLRQIEGRIPVIVVGDAKSPGKSQEAILNAFESVIGYDKMIDRGAFGQRPLYSKPLVEAT